MRTAKLSILGLVLVCLFAAGPAAATTKPSLGLSLGAIFPKGELDTGEVSWTKIRQNWGFFVDLPLIKTFHISPSAELYKLDDISVADMNMAFKFMIPLNKLSIWVAVVPGVTSMLDDTRLNIGGAVGLSARLVGNVAWFAQGKFKEIFGEPDTIHMVHVNGGVMFYF